MKKRIRKKSEKYIQKCLLLTPQEQDILSALSEKAGISQNEFLRKTINWLVSNETVTIQSIAKEIDLIKKYLIRQNCPYCKSYDLVGVEKESTVDRDVQLCQACKRKSMYITQNGYFELVPYDFYTQANALPPDTPMEIEKFQYKVNERDMEDIKKILIDDKVDAEILKIEKITCVKCGFQSYCPQWFYHDATTSEGPMCKACIKARPVNEKEGDKEDADNKME